MPFILFSKEVSKKDIKLVGGKAANIGEMTQAGFPVPEAFFVTTDAYKKFLKENELKNKIMDIINKIDFNDVNSLKSASNEIKSMIINAEMPADVKDAILRAYKKLYGGPEIDIQYITPLEKPFVAVRSSGVTEDIEKASSAGQYETFLNVKGDENLILSIKKCWASLYTPRAIFYRNKNNQPQDTVIGVVVQKMVNAEKSGVMFTVDPTNPVEYSNHIVIEATWGLGETLVQGEVEPDRYVVDKTTGNILEKKIGAKHIFRTRDIATGQTIKMKVYSEKVNAQVLSDIETVTLAAYGKKLEMHYKIPQDVEWAIDKNKIYIVQTRSVTTLEQKMEMEKPEGTPILEGLGASPGIVTGIVKIIKDASELDKIEKGDVLVTTMTNPDFVVAMEKSAAIVTDQGGQTSHAAIIARELSIPAIVGTRTATQTLKDGMKVTVDAFHGKIYSGEVAIEEVKENIGEVSTKVEVKVNLAFPETAEKAKHADGVGLMRIEHMLTKAGMHPIEYIRQNKQHELIKILEDNIEIVAKAFYPKPVWVRSLDARTDEFKDMKGGENEPKEDNPMLGWHGIRRSLDEPEILKSELTALKKLHEKGLNNVFLMLPFIINVDELKKAKEIAKQMQFDIKFGIMIETPAAVWSIEEFCEEGIDFISFGSNDLTQLTLGIDRNNNRLIKLFDEMHPAMQKQFEHVIEICKKYGVKTSICGEAPSNRFDIVEFLVKLGIDSISVNIDAIDKVRKWVFQIEKDLGKTQ